MTTIYDIIHKDKGSKDRPALNNLLYSNKPQEFLSTGVISLNLAYSGKVSGGIPKSKMSMISAPSMLGKSFVAMSVIKDAQKKGMDVCLIDTERAFSKKLAEGLGVNTDKKKLNVIQESSIETIKSSIMTICNQFTKEQCHNLLFVIDSWGCLVTSKTLKDALTGNDVADMTEPKKKNQLANVCHNTQATFFIINHVYDNTGGFGDPLQIPGGRKAVFLSDVVLLGMSRAKDKDSQKNITGHIITTKIFKSRYSKGESKLKFRIKDDGGLDTFYGILEDAVEGGFVENNHGRYTRTCVKDDKKWLEKDLYCSEFWLPVFKETDFKTYLQDKYELKDDFDIVKNQDAMDEIHGDDA